MPDREIANANRTRLALGAQRFQSVPALPAFPHRVMDQIKIHIIQLELTQTRVQCALGISMIGIPQFRRDKNVLPGNAAHSDGSADTLLVAIHGRSIDVPVPRFQGGKDRRRDHRIGPFQPFQSFNRYALFKSLQPMTSWRGLARFENYQNGKMFSDDSLSRAFTYPLLENS